MCLPHTPCPSLKTILIIDVSEENYRAFLTRATVILEVSIQYCPKCCYQGRFKYHGTYEKYLFDQSLYIFRVRCCCGCTHAIMPSFSVPWRSWGMVAVETWLKRREEGLSRRQAALGLPQQVDWSRTGLRLERALHRLEPVIKAALPSDCISIGHGLALLATMAGTTENILTTMNRRCLAAGIPPLYFARIGGSRCGHNKSGRNFSHDLAATRIGNTVPNSA